MLASTVIPTRSIGLRGVLVLLALGGVVPVLAQTVDLSEARRRVDALRDLLRSPDATDSQLSTALDAVDEANRALDPSMDDGERASLHSAVEDLLLDALVDKQVPPGQERNERHAVQVHAARVLGHTRATVVPRFLRALERVDADRDYDPYPAFWSAAFDSLVDLDAPRAFDWLLDTAINAEVEPSEQHRTVAALQAIARCEGLPARQRRRGFARLVGLFQSFTFHVESDYDYVAGFRGSKRHPKMTSAGVYWALVVPSVHEALRRLGTDPVTGLPPLDIDTGEEMNSISRYQTWFGRNKRLGAPPWIDGPQAGRARAELPYVRPLPVQWRQFGTPWTDWWMRNRNLEDPAQSDTVERRALVAAPPALQEALVPLLADEAAPVRAAAAVQVGRLRLDGAASLLRGRLATESDESVRDTVVLGIAILAQADQLEYLRTLAADEAESPAARAYAFLGLGFLGDAAHVGSIADGTTPVGASDRVRCELRACAVGALGLAGDEARAARLARLLVDRDAPAAVRGEAGAPLAALASHDLQGPLLDVLRETRDMDSKLASQTAAAIGLSGTVARDDARAFRALQTRLREGKERFHEVRTQIAFSLARIGGPEAYDVIAEEYDRLRPRSQRYAERGFFLLALGAAASQERHREALRAEFGALDHDFDRAACALALALAGDRDAAAMIRDSVPDAGPELLPHALVALALLHDPATPGLARIALGREGRDRTMREAALALALTQRARAVPELLEAWERCREPDDYDAVARALRLAGGADAIAPLLAIAQSRERAALERAFALVALGRITDPEPRPLLDRLAPNSNPHSGCLILLDLARYRDASFLYGTITCPPRRPGDR